MGKFFSYCKSKAQGALAIVVSVGKGAKEDSDFKAVLVEHNKGRVKGVSTYKPEDKESYEEEGYQMVEQVTA